MDYYVAPLARLIEQFERLPGIGHKTARRLAFFVLDSTENEANQFADAITSAKRLVKYCSVCQNITDTNVCSICDSTRRDKSIICVMQSPKDVISLEKTREYNGLYHVLHGAILIANWD